MASYRRSTLFDLSGLKLQEDANRVNPQVGKKSRPSQSRIRLQDSRGNWTARDAGGSAQVKRYTRITGSKTPESQHPSEDEAPDQLDPAEGPESVYQLGQHPLKDGNTSGVGRDSLDGTKRKRKGQKDARPSKKLKLAQGLDYLVREAEENRSGKDGKGALPVPSSEMLKIIHQFAGQYYTEQGLLSNISARYRQERKARKEAKGKGKAKASKSTKEDDDVDEESGGGSDRDSSPSDNGSNSSNSESDTETQPTTSKKRPRRSEHYRDMYKAFDGSALLAIGMLVQEFVKETLGPRSADASRWQTNSLPRRGGSTKDTASQQGEEDEDAASSESSTQTTDTPPPSQADPGPEAGPSDSLQRTNSE